MIVKLDSRHDGLVKMQDGRWYARRPLQQSDLSGIHMDPPPLNCADKRVLDGEEWKAADLIVAPLDAEDIAFMGLDQAKADRINSEIIAMPDNILTLKDRLKMIEQLYADLKENNHGN